MHRGWDNTHSTTRHLCGAPQAYINLVRFGLMWTVKAGGPFCQCNLSLCPYIWAFLPVQSVPMPIYRGLFAGAKCPHG